MLAGAGNEDARRIIGALGAQDELRQKTQKGAGGKSPIPEADAKALMVGTMAAVEARYEALGRYMRTEGYTNLLDIACGYTPRSLYCAQAGIDYVGVDVPVVAEELQAMFEGLGIEMDHPAYVGGDATNAASLMAAADMLQGTVLVSCEGLMQYLAEDEFEQFLGGVREVLSKHGGVWVTSDMGVDYETFATACMSSPDAAELYHAARRQTMAASNIFNEGVSFWDEDRRLSFIEGHGFRVEQVPFYHDDEDLVMLRNVPEAWRKAITERLDASRLWVMSVDEDYRGSQAIEGASQVENLSIEYARQGAILHCKEDGRIDTISAPTLMEVIDANCDGASELRMDTKGLEYISSAGLRVLMMALKRMGEGSVTVLNATDGVREIFETTGFDEFINVR